MVTFLVRAAFGLFVLLVALSGSHKGPTPDVQPTKEPPESH